MIDNILLFGCICIIIVTIYIIYQTYNDHPLRLTTPLSTIEPFDLQSNYTNYDTLITKLNQLYTNVNNISVETQNFINAHPVYDSSISTTNYNNIEDYQKTLQSKTADAQFFIDQAVKEKRIAILGEELDRLANDSNLPQIINNTPKLSIKNPYAGVNLNLEPIPNDNNNSLIYLNGKCMSYNTSGDYSLKDCDINDPLQKFKTTQINFVEEYNSIINDSQANFRITGDIFEPIAGFSAVQPSNSNNKDCLTIANNNVTIEPCNLSLYQRWNASNNKVTC